MAQVIVNEILRMWRRFVPFTLTVLICGNAGLLKCKVGVPFCKFI